MGAAIAVLMFLAFVALDYALNRKREAAAVASATTTDPGILPGLEPVWVAGYEQPEELYYHPAHTWAQVVSNDTVAVGVDDFAGKLLGKVTTLKLPKVGSWLRQGATGFEIVADGREAAFLSPVEGQIIETNRELRDNPELAVSEPYRRGWLFKVRSASLAANLRNLLSGSTARRWLEDSRDQLRYELMAFSGSVLQDGGEPAPDFWDHLDPEEWRRMVSRFLRT